MKQKEDLLILIPKYVVITSNYHPDLWYDKLKVDYKALYRRINFLFEFEENNVICHINNPPSDEIPSNVVNNVDKFKQYLTLIK